MAAATAHPPRILLVGPNPFGPRKSMWLFVECLAQGLGAAGVSAEVLRPRFPTLGRLGQSRITQVALRLVLEAAQLRRAARRADLIHVGDHASAFHLLARGLRHRPKVVTCHDVFFIASTLQAGRAAPRTERWWQERIFRGIARADRIVCISTATRTAVHDLLRNHSRRPAATVVVPNGLYQPFVALPETELATALAAVDPRLRAGRYVLHVGGNFERKNRGQVVATFAAFTQRQDLRLVLAGEPPNGPLRDAIDRAGLAELTTVVAQPTATVLGHLYQGAFALLFPSWAEGFGLPPVEAQTLGCPVVCSDLPPHRENLADTALLAPADDTRSFVGHLATLLDPRIRSELAERGRRNAQRFSSAAMINSYASLYRELLQVRPG